MVYTLNTLTTNLDVNYKRVEILYDMYKNTDHDIIHLVTTAEEEGSPLGGLDYKRWKYGSTHFLWIESLASLGGGAGQELLQYMITKIGEMGYIGPREIWLAAYKGSGAFYEKNKFHQNPILCYEEKRDEEPINAINTIETIEAVAEAAIAKKMIAKGMITKEMIAEEIKRRLKDSEIYHIYTYTPPPPVPPKPKPNK